MIMWSTSSTVGLMPSGEVRRIDEGPRMETVPPGHNTSPSEGGRSRNSNVLRQSCVGNDERALGEKNLNGRVGETGNLSDPGTGGIDDLFGFDGLFLTRKDVFNPCSLNLFIADFKLFDLGIRHENMPALYCVGQVLEGSAKGVDAGIFGTVSCDDIL